MIKTIFWDFGGVIVRDNIQPAFRELGIPYGATAVMAWREHKLSYINQEEYFTRCLNGHLDAKEKLRALTDALLTVHPEGALSIIEELQGRYKQGVISNHSREWGRTIVERLGLERYLKPIIISAEVGMDKSGQDIFYHALRLTDTSPDHALFVDNQENNILVARSVGMNAVLFEGREKLKKDMIKYDIIL